MLIIVTPTNVTSTASYLTYLIKNLDVSVIFWPSIERVLQKFLLFWNFPLYSALLARETFYETIGSIYFMVHTSQIVANILGCSYRASSVRITIRLPTDANLYFRYLFPFLPYMFRALISPSSGVSQAVIYIYIYMYTTIWFMQCLCCSSACACGLVCCGGFAVKQWNHHDKPVNRHTQTSSINTAWTKWLYIYIYIYIYI